MENNNPQNEQELQNEIQENTAAETSQSAEAAGSNDLKKAQDELADAKDKYLRLYSEFENFRRRTAREKLDLIQSANEKLVNAFLPIIDDFERAEKAFKGSESKEMEGFLLIYTKFKKILDQAGIKVMEAKGTDFNPDLHEAITQVPAPNESQKGKVMDVVENGYLLNDKVIRFAKVVVGS
ncbi:MAG: nucleotide exchange factor GrpE [Cyclobacteriaceae bacterium]|nr:nucleotide exchange factor GrpE [Cyclobacteriaceae bacterium]